MSTLQDNWLEAMRSELSDGVMMKMDICIGTSKISGLKNGEKRGMVGSKQVNQELILGLSAASQISSSQKLIDLFK